MLMKIDQRHDEMHAEIATVRDNVFLEVAQVTRQLESLEACVSENPLAHEPFAPDVTIIIASLLMLSQTETKAQLLERVQDVMTNGLLVPGTEAVAVTRCAARGSTPGLVLVELPCLDDKWLLRGTHNGIWSRRWNRLSDPTELGDRRRLSTYRWYTLLDPASGKTQREIWELRQQIIILWFVAFILIPNYAKRSLMT